MTVLPYDNESKSWGEPTEIEIILADKYAHYLAMNSTPELLEAFDIHPGDPFMGVASYGSGQAILSTTGGRDRLIGPFATDLSTTERVLYGLTYPLQIFSIPLTFDGEIMTSAESDMLDLGPIHQEIINGIFWLVWINFILGFANLIPLVPFDGGHLMRDAIRGSIQSVSKRIRVLHPQRVEIFANKTANIASLLFVGIFVLPILFRLIV
jgi:Zn-dependent protease